MSNADGEMAAYIQEHFNFTPTDVEQATPAAIAAAYGLTIDQVTFVIAADSAKSLRDLAETWAY